ncbi:general stress protein [Planotetraspora mira]|nr:general stress protein [Planotetraspora mira]
MFGSPASGTVAPMVDMRPLASYHDYASAQRTVDALSDIGFPVEQSAIVGSDLRLEERVTGRLTSGRAALRGLGNGAVIGLVIGLFLGLFTATTISFIGIVVWSIIWAAIVGAIFGYVAHALSRGARDFSSRSSIVAGRYDVLVAAPMVDQARAALADSGAMTSGPGQGGTAQGPGTMHMPGGAGQGGGMQAPSGQDRMGMPGRPSMERPEARRTDTSRTESGRPDMEHGPGADSRRNRPQ